MPRYRGYRLVIATPALSALMLVLAVGVPDFSSRVLLAILVVVLTWVALVARDDTPEYWMRTAANLVDALREGDFSVRAAVPRGTGEYEQLIARLNHLAAQLHDERRGMAESMQLLNKTLASLDGAVFAFDGEAAERLRLVNPAGERLLACSAADLLGRSAEVLGLTALFAVSSGSVLVRDFPTQRGRWQISHANLRSKSQVGRLLVVLPMESALRKEEADAFRRLLRVLSHEINNSIAPIASVSDTLRSRASADDVLADDADTKALLVHGLTLIEQRSLALQRFISGYSALARLPPPQVHLTDVGEVCRRVHGLLDDGRIALRVKHGVVVYADRDQLEHVLINLLRNALEATPADGGISLEAHCDMGGACIDIIDDGPGPPQDDSLFVPFFTTKPGGSGIGLVLSRQIVEAQSGTLTLTRRTDHSGAIARVLLPMAALAGTHDVHASDARSRSLECSR